MADYIKSKLSGRVKLVEEPTFEESSLEMLCKTDQVMHFFEYELESHRGFVSDCLKEFQLQDTNGMDSLKAGYIASLTRIDELDNRIKSLVDNFCHSRDECKAASVRDQPNIMDRLSRQKSEIGSLLDTREIIGREHQSQLDLLRGLIAKIKLARLQSQEVDPKNLATTVGNFDQPSSSGRNSRRFTVDEVRRIIST